MEWISAEIGIPVLGVLVIARDMNGNEYESYRADLDNILGSGMGLWMVKRGETVQSDGCFKSTSWKPFPNEPYEGYPINEQKKDPDHQ
jgi:hypothetical protein